MSRFTNISGRYVLAVFVAFVVSCAIFALLGFVPFLLALYIVPHLLMFMQFVIPVMLTVMGFSGVFTGSLCLDRPGRRFGSVALLILGLTFFVCFALFFQKYLYFGDVDRDHPYPWLGGLAALAVGGAVAVIIVFRRSSSNTALEPPPTAP